jgi:YhfZ C-terminal domain/Helix-turn-helix domain
LNEKKKSRRSVKDLQIRLAESLIQLKIGQRLPSIRNLAASTHMSVGSVSTALNGLQDLGAVKIEKRGHLGSVLVDLSVVELWNLVEGDPLVIAMTLPMHRRFEGLATGIKMSLERAGISVYLIFIRGSRTRLKALREKRCHVAIMSGLAASELCDDGQEILCTLPPGTWVSNYSLFYRQNPLQVERMLRVVVDPDSYDHKRLTELEFEGQQVELRPASFVQFPRLLKNGEIDALVWTTDQEEAFLGNGIANRPISDRVMQLAGEKSISATFVGRAGSDILRAVLNTTLDPDEIMQVQREVVRGKLIPEY